MPVSPSRVAERHAAVAPPMLLTGSVSGNIKSRSRHGRFDAIVKTIQIFQRPIATSKQHQGRVNWRPAITVTAHCSAGSVTPMLAPALALRWRQPSPGRLDRPADVRDDARICRGQCSHAVRAAASLKKSGYRELQQILSTTGRATTLSRENGIPRLMAGITSDLANPAQTQNAHFDFLTTVAMLRITAPASGCFSVLN
ncbi:MAG: hypothetical protein U5L02_06515 [Rheinheimera sp.]|nr:hypothetical protein [Rheinheimera sp.]